jgi:hypothetical protein
LALRAARPSPAAHLNPTARREKTAGGFLLPHVTHHPRLPVLRPSSPPTCACGRLRDPARERCCPGCDAARHNTACNMRQVTLADAAGIAPPPGFCLVALRDGGG